MTRNATRFKTACPRLTTTCDIKGKWSRLIMLLSLKSSEEALNRSRMVLLPHHTLLILQHMADLQRDAAEHDLAIAQLVQRRRRFWVKPWLQRFKEGLYMASMSCSWASSELLHDFVRMEPVMFRELLVRLGPRSELAVRDKIQSFVCDRQVISW